MSGQISVSSKVSGRVRSYDVVMLAVAWLKSTWLALFEVRLFQDGCFALKSPAAIALVELSVITSRSDRTIFSLDGLYVERLFR